MITLHHAKETDFSKNGFGVLDSVIFNDSGKWEMNGEFIISFEIPAMTEYTHLLVNRNIIQAPVPFMDRQLFRIYRIEKTLQSIYVEARHIFYDLLDNWVEDTNIVSKVGNDAIQQLLSNTQYPHSFIATSNIDTSASARIVRMNPVAALLDDGKNNSFLRRWGGELVRNNYHIEMLERMGSDRGIKIEHKRDLMGYSATFDVSTIVTRIHPVGFDGLELPEKYVDSQSIDLDHPIISEVKYDDIKAAVGEYTEDEDAVPLEQAYNMLREAAQNEFEQNHVDEPETVVNVDFVALHNTEQYKHFKQLQEVKAGDTVKVAVYDHAFEITSRLVAFDFSLLKENHYTSTTLGNHVYEFTSSGVDVSELRQRVEQAEQSAVNAMQAANGRNRNFFGTDDPDTIQLNARVGDLFFREEGERKWMYRYVEVNGERYWKIETDSEELDQVKNNMEEQQLAIQEAQDSADAANQQINDAVINAGFTSLTDTISYVDNLASTAEANAQAALSRAIDAHSLATDSISRSQEALSNSNNAVGLAQGASSLATTLSGQVSDFELTVNGFNQTVNNYTNQVAQFTSDVNGLNSTVANYGTQVGAFGNTVSTYATQVSQFQNTVSGLNSTVSSYQSDVQGYQAQVSTLTNTVDGFNATVQRVEADYSSLNGTVQSLGASIGVVQGQITNRVWQTDIQSAVDRIEVGGRNLLRNSDFSDGLYNSGDDRWQFRGTVGELSPGGNLLIKSGVGSSISMDTVIWISNREIFSNGSYLTVTFKLKANSSNTILIRLGGAGWGSGTHRLNISSELRDYSVSFPINNSSDNARAIVFWLEQAGEIEIDRIKVEKGNKSTDWTPAPEDTLQLISNVETEWRQTAQGFNQSITRIESDVSGKASLVAFNTLESKVGETIQRIGDAEGNITQIEANVSGLQTTVASKASQTQVTQLANAYNISVREQISSMWTVLTSFSSGSNIDYRRVSDDTVLQVDVTGNSNATSGNDNRIWSASFTMGTIYTIAFEARKVSGTVPGRATFGQSNMGNSGWEMSIGSGWGQYGGTYTANSHFAGSLFFHVEGRYEIRNLKVFIGGGASQGQLSVLEDQINLRVSKGEVMSQINIEAGRTLIQSNRLYLDAQSVVFSGSAFIPNAAIESLSADKLTAGTIDANIANIINLNTSDITGLNAEFVRTRWNDAVGGSVSIDAGGIDSTQTNVDSTHYMNLSGGQIYTESTIQGESTPYTSALFGQGELNIASHIGAGTSISVSGTRIQFIHGTTEGTMRFNGTNFVLDNNLGLFGNHINSVDWLRLVGNNNYEMTIHKHPTSSGGAIVDSSMVTLGMGTRNSFQSIAQFYGQIDFRRNLFMMDNDIRAVRRVSLNNSNTHFISHPSTATPGGVIVDSTRFTIGIGSVDTGFNDRITVTNSQIDLRAHTNLQGFRLDNVARIGLTGTNGWYMHLSTGTAIVDTRMVTIAIGNLTSVDRVADFYGRIDFYKNLNMNGNVINNQSDARLKTNIVEHEQSSLEKINAFNFVDFRWVRDGRNDFGLIAQEVQQVAPELISEDSQGILSINNTLLNMMTTHAIQELSKEHENTLLVASHAYLLAEQHEDELAELRKENQKLKERIEALEGAA